MQGGGNDMEQTKRRVLVVGGGTAGSVLAARLSEDPAMAVTLLEAGPDDSEYHPSVLDPARSLEVWAGATPLSGVVMASEHGDIPMVQGRILGGTSAVNAMATLRGQPSDYDKWAAAGLDGWGWSDIERTFITAESDADFGDTPLHGTAGPLPVRRWHREHYTVAHAAFLDGMLETGNRFVDDINDPAQLPGVGIFPATVDADWRRVTTSLAYLTPEVRSRPNLDIRTQAEVARITIDAGRTTGVVLADGEEIEADEVVVTAGALWSPALLMLSGVGPARHLADHGITLQADLPVGETMSDHLGPGIDYRHPGSLGGNGSPAQTLMVGSRTGASIDYHAFPLQTQDADGHAEFQMVVFMLRSSGQGSVRLGATPEAGLDVTAPPLPEDAMACFRHAFDRLAAWEMSAPAKAAGIEQADPIDLTAHDAVDRVLARGIRSYAHMAGTCPMGPVLDADCRVHGIEGLRVADSSVMPTIPSGNTYLGCVMVAEQVARKMAAGG
jgi:choline dehydrogenase